LLSAIGILVGRATDLITDQMLIWGLLISGMATGSYALAIGATEYYKRRTFSQKQIECINDPHSTGCDKEKRKTHDCAVRSGFGAMAACGVIFVLLEGAGWRVALVISVLWLIGCMIIGVTTPLIYRLFRKRFLTVAGENEALDRPSEVPRE